MISSGNNCKNSKKRNNNQEGKVVYKRPLTILLLLGFLGIISCGKDQSERKEIPREHSSAVKLSPRLVNIGGIHFYQTYAETKARYHGLRSRLNDIGDTICTWKPTKADQRRGFAGIATMSLTFVKGQLHEIKVYYGEMVDAEYRPFEETLKKTFGSPPTSSENSSYRWLSDSLAIMLIPNRKLHWTKSVNTYSPVVHYQERILRK